MSILSMQLHRLSFKNLFVSLLLVLGVLMPSINTYAATDLQRGDALRGSEWDDQESVACSAEVATTQSDSTSTPGKLFILGDSIGQGLSTALPSELKPEEGWNVTSDTRVGRPLGEGISVAQTPPPDLSAAQYILVVLGTNPDSKLNGAGMQEMITALRAPGANPSAPILWLELNVARSDLVAGATEFNTLLSASSQLKVIKNEVALNSDGVHPASYTDLAKVVGSAFKSGTGVSTGSSPQASNGCVCSSSTTSGSNVDKNLSLGSEAPGRRVNLIRLLMTDFGLAPHQAAGIIGNFTQESGGAHMPPDVNQGTTTGAPPNSSDLGYGWAQWSGARKHEFVRFGIDNGFVAEGENFTDAADYAFLKFELTGGYSSTIDELKTKDNPTDAARSFHSTFEKSGDGSTGIGERETDAEKWFLEYQSASSSGASIGQQGAPCSAGSAAIVGDTAFPLLVSKKDINNRGMFANNTADQGGHPYIAYDILVGGGLPVAAFLSGKVTHITKDKCPGRMISVYNSASNLTISYLHLDFNNHAAEGDELSVGQQLGITGAAANGCGTAHLHIDAAEGESRPGCARENCPADKKAKFRDIGPQLFATYQLLPE